MVGTFKECEEYKGGGLDTYKEFENNFRGKYLFERYFDNKSKDFYELKVGKML